MKAKFMNCNARLKEALKANLIRLFVKESVTSYQDIYKSFLLTHCENIE